MIEIHDSLHAVHFGIGFVPIQCKAMFCGGRMGSARAKAVDREEFVSVVELDHVSDHADRFFVSIAWISTSWATD